MKLLIVTQKADKNDPVLGFFPRWIKEFSTHSDRVTVIAQMVGEYDLPDNVSVYSLKKEKGLNLFKQIFRLWYLQIKHKKNYDCVFVHMIPWWVILGAPLWKLINKPIYLWYLHKSRTIKLKLALMLVENVFTATLINNGVGDCKKTIVTGHAIDTDLFCPKENTIKEKLIISVGRITAAKNFNRVIDVLATLPADYQLKIIGVPCTKNDQAEENRLKKQTEDLNLNNRIVFLSLTQKELVPLLQAAALFIHASDTGLDKAALEAMSCGCLTVSTLPAVKRLLPEILQAETNNLPQKANQIINLPEDEKIKLSTHLREIICKKHSLKNTIRLIAEKMH